MMSLNGWWWPDTGGEKKPKGGDKKSTGGGPKGFGGSTSTFAPDQI